MPIRTLFVDIGNVLLTNGWDSETRRRAAARFGFEEKESDSRHRMTFDTYEMGKITLDEYLNRVFFYEPRNFTREAFCQFMYEQSQQLPDMLDFVRDLKKRHGLKVVAVSNEGRELTEYRIRTFALDNVIDFFVSSCFVHLRKPDLDIFRMAIDMAQTPPQESAYLDDRKLFVEVAGSLGMNAIHHTEFARTKAALAALGLE